MLRNLIKIVAVLAVPFIASAETTIIEEQTNTGKLTNPAIIKTARDVVAENIGLEWDEGARSFKSFLTGEADDLDIKRVKTVNGRVTEMDVVVRIELNLFEVGMPAPEPVAGTCEVFLEKSDGIFESNYFMCTMDDGQDIEWER